MELYLKLMESFHGELFLKHFLKCYYILEALYCLLLIIQVASHISQSLIEEFNCFKFLRLQVDFLDLHLIESKYLNHFEFTSNIHLSIIYQTIIFHFIIEFDSVFNIDPKFVLNFNCFPKLDFK